MTKRGVAQNSVLAFVGDVASKSAALLVVLIAARSLSVEEFSILATALAGTALLSALLDLGAATLITRDGARSKTARGGLFRALAEARAPFAIAVLCVAPLVGLAIGRPLTAIAVAALAISGTLASSVLALFRSCQDIAPEALQRLAGAILSVASVALCCLLLPQPGALLAALAASILVTLLPLAPRARVVADFTREMRPGTALRRAAPIGLLALATVAYYRSGTLALAVLADPTQTAAFTVAASVAFGLLLLPNAITTALLPRLSAEIGTDRLVASARPALGWTLVLATLISIVAAGVGPFAVPFVLGPGYTAAVTPFVLLCLGLPIIAASGVIGTALLSVGRIRVLGVQVACTLAVNLAALAVLVPTLGAVGASLATIACELTGLALLVNFARRDLPGLIDVRPSATSARIEPSTAATP
jgi:O-antigen/teichoic acid export membrane protein